MIKSRNKNIYLEEFYCYLVVQYCAMFQVFAGRLKDSAIKILEVTAVIIRLHEQMCLKLGRELKLNIGLLLNYQLRLNCFRIWSYIECCQVHSLLNGNEQNGFNREANIFLSMYSGIIFLVRQKIIWTFSYRGRLENPSVIQETLELPSEGWKY